MWVIQVLIDSPAVPAAEKPFLFNLATRVMDLGRAVVDWEGKWFVDPANGGQYPTDSVTRTTMETHGVNNGMATSECGGVFTLVLRARAPCNPLGGSRLSPFPLSVQSRGRHPSA